VAVALVLSKQIKELGFSDTTGIQLASDEAMLWSSAVTLLTCFD
jgi:hypothetical protein